MYRTLIKPALLHGSESWVVLERDVSLLRVFERKVLRTIFGPVNEGGVFVCMYVYIHARSRNFYPIDTKFGTQIGLVNSEIKFEDGV